MDHAKTEQRCHGYRCVVDERTVGNHVQLDNDTGDLSIRSDTNVRVWGEHQIILGAADKIVLNNYCECNNVLQINNGFLFPESQIYNTNADGSISFRILVRREDGSLDQYLLGPCKPIYVNGQFV